MAGKSDDSPPRRSSLQTQPREAIGPMFDGNLIVCGSRPCSRACRGDARGGLQQTRSKISLGRVDPLRPVARLAFAHAGSFVQAGEVGTCSPWWDAVAGHSSSEELVSRSRLFPMAAEPTHHRRLVKPRLQRLFSRACESLAQRYTAVPSCSIVQPRFCLSQGLTLSNSFDSVLAHLCREVVLVECV